MENQINASWSKLVERLDGWLDNIIVNLPNFILAVIVFGITYWLGQVFKRWSDKFLSSFIKQKSVSNLLSNLVAIVAIGIGFILALSILNLDTALQSILAGAGVAGLAVGLALQGSLANSFSGIFLAVKDIIKVGDWVETNDYKGSVEEISLRSTKIREADNNIVVIPNSMVLDNPFKNYSYTNRMRVSILCGVGYESNLKKVRQLAVQKIADRFEQKDTEEIEFFYNEFGGSSINFVLRFWVDATKKKDMLHAQSEAIILIKEVFDQHDINIPFPIRTLQVENKFADIPAN
ncbi:MAG: mechanosensitive ion channel [Saprospiraceae bacterium]